MQALKIREDLPLGELRWLAEAEQDLRVAQRLLAIVAALKRRLSEFAREPSCNQEYASGLQQRLNDKAEAVIAQGEAPIFQDPGIAALDGPAPPAKP